MFFAEPPPTRYDVHFIVAGVPVRIHPWFWGVTLLLGLGPDGDPVRMLLWTLAEFVCILIHELGHVAAFRYYGMDAHVVLHGFGGLAIPTGGRWGGRGGSRETWLSDVVISLAGPVAGFVFAAVIYLGLAASGRSPAIHFDPYVLIETTWKQFDAENVNELIRFALFINIVWGLVNLMPIYPLDGGQVARAVLGKFSPTDGLRQSLQISVLAAAGMAVLGFVRWQSFYTALFFGFMAYNNYQTLQQISGRGRW